MKWTIRRAKTLSNLRQATVAALLLLSVGQPSLCGEGPLEAESVLLRLIDEVDVPASSAGVLANVHVVEGQAVEAGQQLGHIDDFQSDLLLERAELELRLTTMQIQNDVSVRTAEAELTFAEQSYLRMKKAADSLPGSVSDAEVADLQLAKIRAELAFEDARRRLELAKATKLVKENDVRTMRRKVDIQRIVAPIAGTVEQVLHKAGEWVEPGEKVFRVISMRRLRAEGFIPGTAISANLAGASVKVTLQGAKPNETFPGKVSFVHAEVDPVSGQIRIWAEIDNRAGKLRPGMRARMTIEPSDATRGGG